MSEKNIEIVRSLYEAFDQLDPAAFEMLDPSVTWDSPDFLDQGSYRGHAGVRDFLAHIPETWEDFEVEPESFRPVGNKVLVFARLSGRAKRGRISIDLGIGHVWTLHEGRVTALRIYRDRQEALEAVGLSE